MPVAVVDPRALEDGRPRGDEAPASFGERFLALPDLFPARQSGERWGAEHAVIRMAGADFVCAGLSATQAAAVRARFGSHGRGAADPSREAVAATVFRASPDDFVTDEREWDFDFDLEHAPESVAVAGFRVMARLDFAPRLHAALWVADEGELVTRSILENVLRMLTAYHLLERGGLLLHSAALADERGARVYFGPSGAGKSTIARLGVAAGQTVLSDDLNGLRTAGDAVFVEKLPFAGDFRDAAAADGGSHRVRDLCRLEQGSAPALRALSPAAAVAALLECAPFVNRDPYRLDRLLERLQALAARLPVRVLTFGRDDRFLALFDP